MNNSLQQVIKELEDLFSKCNKKFFADEIEKPVITVSPDTSVGAFGWCTTWKAWKDDSSDGYYEINICAEHLNRSFEDICATMLHEMVHLHNIQNDMKDTSRGGTYHNKKFKETAEMHGLIIDKDPKYGWCRTSLNEEAQEFLQTINGKSFSLYRTKFDKISDPKKCSSSRKYVCPDCGTIIRATKEVQVTCTLCQVDFELAE